MNTPNNQKQWDFLWVHAQLATMTGGGFGIVGDGALGVKDGRIAWVGPMQALPGAPQALAAEVRDAGRRWLTPGLIDCHTHLVHAGDRAGEFAMRLAGKSYTEIARAGGGILSTLRATRAASEEELCESAARRLGCFLREGVTTIEIKSGYGLDLENELKMLRVARKLGELHPVSVHATFLGAHALPPEYAGKADAYVDLICEKMLPEVARLGLADSVDGFCERIAFSPAQMERIFAAAGKYGLPVRLHAEQLSDQGGAALAAKYRALSADHLEHVNEAGVRAMAEAGTAAVLLPGAFYTLRETKKPPIDLFRQYGVKMALASDCNPGTSPVTSLLLMLNFGCVLFGLSPEEVLLGVTAHAAQALGLADMAGTLEIGKAADMALWDIKSPVELCYRLGYNPCAGVMKWGVYHAFI